jgi:ammonia channel protein AmtB
LFDGIVVGSITVSVITVTASTVTWMLLSWASAGSKNDAKVITSQNLFTGILSGYVVATYLSGWIGPMTGIVFGVLASASCYGIFSIKRRVLSEQ